MNRLIKAAITLSLFFSSIAIVGQQAQQQPQQHVCPPAIDQDGAEVLSNFAGIVVDFLSLVQAPNNPANVGQHLAGMVHGLANILTIATRGGAEFAQYVNSPEFQQKIADQIIKRTQCITPDLDQM